MPSIKGDPSRTVLLRRRFYADISRRFAAVRRENWKFMVTDDAFGLKARTDLLPHALEEPPTYHHTSVGLVGNIQKRQYQFLTNPNKMRTYRKWLNEQINMKLLSTDGITGKPWSHTYIESAYKKGMMRAYVDTNPAILAQSPDWYAGSQAQFLKSAFAQPELLSKIELVATRSFEQLRGVTTTMAQQMNRHLADGLAHGEGPETIARRMSRDIARLSRTRARMIARTEIINAHAEGQLDSFEMLGVKKVGVMAEWVTAASACEACLAMSEEGPYKLKEARGMIPLHPNCRCAWVPTQRKGKLSLRQRLALV